MSECRACGARTDRAARFCATCGARLGAGAPRPPTGGGPEPPRPGGRTAVVVAGVAIAALAGGALRLGVTDRDPGSGTPGTVDLPAAAGPPTAAEAPPSTASGGAERDPAVGAGPPRFEGPVACLAGAGQRLRGDGGSCLRWSADIGATITGLGVRGRTVYATTASAVVALDALDGTERWRVPTLPSAIPPGVAERSERWSVLAGPAGARPVVADGRVVVGLLDGGLVGLDARTGRRTWRLSLDQPARAMSAGATSVAVLQARQVVTVSASGGRLWQVPAPTARAVAVGDGVVVAAGPDGITAWDEATGRPAWSRPDLAATQVVVDGGVAAVLGAGQVRRVDAATGDTLGAVPLPDRAGDLLPLGDGPLAAVTASAVTRLDGAWTVRVGGRGVGTAAGGGPVTPGLVVVAGAGTQTLVALDMGPPSR